jgi:hypothetical protein
VVPAPFTQRVPAYLFDELPEDVRPSSNVVGAKPEAGSRLRRPVPARLPPALDGGLALNWASAIWPRTAPADPPSAGGDRRARAPGKQGGQDL